MNTQSLRSPVLLIICIAIPLLAGVAGSFSTMSSIATWYTGLIKPVLTPPNWLFGPVWTTLYILMGIALYLVIREGTEKKPVQLGIMVFAAQLIVNVVWSLVFFGLQSPLLGLITILVLIALVLATIYFFYHVSRTAAVLLVPYIVWVCIATYLNAMILVLN
ncbi:MAG: TspO/MBR family protein [Methanomicrobiales archaeon]